MQVPPPVQEQPGAAGASSVRCVVVEIVCYLLISLGVSRRMRLSGTPFCLVRGLRGGHSGMWAHSSTSARPILEPAITFIAHTFPLSRFLVEKESELYYDATPLLEATRSLTESNNASASQSQSANPNTATTSAQQRQLQIQQQQRQAAFSAQQYPYPNPNNNGTPMMAHATGTPTRGGMGYPATPGAGGPQGQYFGDGAGTPSRGGMMNGVSATPEGYGRRITRGMSDGYPVYAN